MKEDEILLISLSYENYISKILKSYFSVYIFPLFLIVDIGIVISIINYENLQQLGRSFAAGGVILVLSFVNMLTIIIFAFSMKVLLKRYYKLDISDKTVTINNQNSYSISDIKYTCVPTTSIMSRAFMLVNKKTNTIIGHFIYEFSDVIFFENSPEMIEQILQSNSQSNIEFLKKKIAKDREQVRNIKKIFSKIRVLSLISFILLLFFLISMLMFRFHAFESKGQINNNPFSIDMPPKIIYFDDNSTTKPWE